MSLPPMPAPLSREKITEATLQGLCAALYYPEKIDVEELLKGNEISAGYGDFISGIDNRENSACTEVKILEIESTNEAQTGKGYAYLKSGQCVSYSYTFKDDSGGAVSNLEVFDGKDYPALKRAILCQVLYEMALIAYTVTDDLAPEDYFMVNELLVNSTPTLKAAKESQILNAIAEQSEAPEPATTLPAKRRIA